MDASAAEHADETQEPGGEEETIVGDSGQQPLSQSDQHDPNAVGPQSAPPAAAQSGVPLPEDRAAGVQPNDAFRGDAQGHGPDGQPLQPGPAEGEATEQDGTQH